MRLQDWIGRVNGVAVAQVAPFVGLEIRGRRSAGPCPKCGEQRRSHNDRRPALSIFGTTGQKWKCHQCNVSGDAVDLVVAKMLGDHGKARDWFIDYGFIPDDRGIVYREPPKAAIGNSFRGEPPNPSEVETFWNACSPPSGKALTYAGVRNLVCGEMRQAPHREWAGFYDWWPASWSARWSLVCAAYDVRGNLAGIHARSILDDGKFPKTLWHKGGSKGMLFANAAAREWMSGAARPDGVVFAEGVTDFWRCCTSAPDKPIVGYTSGNETVLCDLPNGPAFIVMQDSDDNGAGDAYVDRILDTNPERSVYKLDWSKIQCPTFPTS